MINKIIIDRLTKDHVHIVEQRYMVEDEKEHKVGEPWRVSYVNSIDGRDRVNNKVAEPYKSIIFMMWGETPTVVEENI